MKKLLILWVLGALFQVSAFAGEVLQGIDQIEELSPSLKGQRVAVLAHHASMSKLTFQSKKESNKQHLVDSLISLGVNLKLIFVPEHGLRSTSDEFVADEIDPETNLPIVSLYKPEQRYPNTENLKEFDTLIIDLKDVGVRFYTFATTVYLTIKECLKQKKRVILLDRVNPLGDKISGPLLEPSLTGHFISYFEFPISHGLTLGEYMNFVFSQNLNNDLLEIITVKNWKPNMLWHETSLEWIKPSPALVDHEQAYLYSIFGALESMNLSVGRGKSNQLAFRNFGAPWIAASQAKTFTQKLNALGLEGIRFEPVSWTVDRALYNGQRVQGFKVILEDFKRVDRFKALYKVSAALLKEFPAFLKFNNWAARYYGSEFVLNLLKKNTSYEMFEKQVLLDQFTFETLVSGYRLYL